MSRQFECTAEVTENAEKIRLLTAAVSYNEDVTHRRTRPTRRIVIWSSIFLMLGAIVNVAVAWACALWSAQESWVSVEQIDVPQSWPSYLEELGWPVPYSATRRRGLGAGDESVGVTVIDLSGGDPDASYMQSGPNTDKTFVSLEVRRFGLPFRALQWEVHGVRAGPRSLEIVRAAASAAGWRTGIDVSEQVGATIEGNMRVLPLTPLWLGFAINTLLYAAILWLLFLTPGTLRRWRGNRRIRRGQCPACAYPIGTSPVCTECGHDLPEARRASTM